MKSNLKSAIFAFLAAVAAAATILIPPASPITVFAGSLCLGLSIGYSKSPIFPAAAAVISCAAAYVVYDKLWIAALILLAIAPSGIAIGLAMKKAKSLDKIIAAHCEDNSLLCGGYIHKGEYARLHGHRGICSESEWKPIERDLELARETGCSYHVCHVSAKESVELIRAAKAESTSPARRLRTI